MTGTSSTETVLVTGASAGIGRELARCFARDGADLVLLARREGRLEALADELEGAHGVGAHVLPADLSEPDAPDAVAQRLDGAGLRPDVLVNNAGFGARGAFAELDAGRQRDMVEVNVSALTGLTRRLLPGMIEAGRGGVLNVASTAAFQPGPYMAVYYATKAYVLSFSEALSEEVAGTGVTVSCLAPGPVKTEFAERAGIEDTPLLKSGATMGPAEVARIGHEGFRAGEALVIPGALNRALAFLNRFLPRALVRKVVTLLHGADE
jgi:hypothetical protein